MSSANGSNLKNIGIMVFVSMVLFGVFYYLITDVTSSSSSPVYKVNKQAYVAKDAEVKNPSTSLQSQIDSTDVKKEENSPENSADAKEVKGDSTQTSVFKSLTTQKPDVQAKVVLGGADEQAPQSTVPETGTDTIFGAFVASSLLMFAGIYMLINQPKGAALAKFEKRIIRELD